MKLINKYLFLISVLFSGYAVMGQQIPIYSQFFMNKYVNNPAFAGINPKFSVSSNHRYQWVGITDAPRTYTLSINGPTKSLKNGLGAFLFTDHVGPTIRTGLQVSYAYHLAVNDKMKLSMSLSGGLLEWKIDGHKLNLTDQNDPALIDNIMRTLVPDAKFGFILYGDKWHFGGSAPNLLQNKITFSNTNNTNLNKLEDHYFIHGGYDFALSNQDFVISPYALVRYVSPAPVQLEAGTKVEWKNSAWAGFTYRTGDAASMLIGYTYKNNLSFGYSFDFTTSNLGNYSTGTHEILFRILFQKK
jgi:type IX secretion system PorP/SprF family membrane protein